MGKGSRKRKESRVSGEYPGLRLGRQSCVAQAVLRVDSRYILESTSVGREKEKERVIKPGDGAPSTDGGKSRERMGQVCRATASALDVFTLPCLRSSGDGSGQWNLPSEGGSKEKSRLGIQTCDHWHKNGI